MRQQSLHVDGKRTHYCRGNALIIVTVFLLVITVTMVLNAFAIPLAESARVTSWVRSHDSITRAESAIEDVAVRIKNGMFVEEHSVVNVGGYEVPITFQTTLGSLRQITATGTAGTAVRAVRAMVNDVPGGEFGYAVQVGPGGFTMANSSDVRGGIVSDGPVTGSNQAIIRGDIFSTGPNGLISSIHATGTARAHTIQNSTIDKDAYYQVLQTTTVGGTKYPNSTDLLPSPMPISDEEIDDMEARAAVNVVTSPCPYKITGGTSTLGPVKIMCDLEISGTNTVTLTGDVWVVGKISTKNQTTIKLDSSYGLGSGVMIADNPANYLTSSTITLENGTTIQNSGTDGSYVVFISRNRSAESGGGTTAIQIGNSAQGELVAYAPSGKVTLANSNEIRGVTGYLVSLANSANISYRNPLKSLYFTSGTGRGWDIVSWKEIE